MLSRGQKLFYGPKKSLKVEIQSLKEFCMEPLNRLTGGRGMSNGTANKLIE
ncbi:Hypothetical predicted protein, partial [Paramuricea clavata]